MASYGQLVLNWMNTIILFKREGYPSKVEGYLVEGGGGADERFNGGHVAILIHHP